MYEQVSHSLLNKVLDELDPSIKANDLRFFYSRLGANFYGIYSLFEKLYGDRPDIESQMHSLIEMMAHNYCDRPSHLKSIDREREADHEWFLHQRWVGMALYANGFAEDLKSVHQRIPYFSELGVNLVHILPILECPVGKSDGGYAVSDFRKVDERIGTNEDLQKIIDTLHKHESLIALDMVVNHTSDEHVWARKAAAGDKHYQDFYYNFETRDIPDMFEFSMPSVFPETDPGNFTWNEDMQRWVMTVFHNYQWDLNYTNPAVFIAMLENIFYWANKGVDVLRLDAVAFLWKKIGTTCQNEREAHLILQLFKDCCQVVSPGLLFIAEAIVAPTEIIKYFGEDAVVAKECEIAYNATFMALIWDAVATKNAKLLNQGIKSLPQKLERATWLNYLRCHDDIGFGFDNNDIQWVGYQPYEHRKFLTDYFTGEFDASIARGQPFGRDAKTGDARISGALASLVGLEVALEQNNMEQIDKCCDHIVLLHSLIMAFGGIPLLYYGDEIGSLNDYEYQADNAKRHDTRWLHRPKLNWDVVAKRNERGSIENRIFSALKKLISVRKETAAFADFNNRELLDLSNESLFGFVRYDVRNPIEKVTVVANLSAQPQTANLVETLRTHFINKQYLVDLWTDQAPSMFDDNLVFKPFQFYWLRHG